MIRILASVRSRAEARAALACPIDILDLKEPDDGALGAADAALVRAVVADAAGAHPVSAAAGIQSDPELLATVRALGRCGADFVKVGFAQPDAGPSLRSIAAALPENTRAVAVLFADAAGMEPFAWLPAVRDAGFAGVMLDTARKGAGSLLDCFAPAPARDWVRAARAAGLLCGLAGRLDLDAAQRYLPCRPDYLGFRSALCRDRDRAATFCAETAQRFLQALCAKMPQSAPARAAGAIAAPQ